jgi:Pentapeptide repeats (8 copies)
MWRISPSSHPAQAESVRSRAHATIEKIRAGTMTPTEILAAISGNAVRYRLLALANQDPSGSVTLSRMHALNIFGNRLLFPALQQLVKSPMPRGGNSRLSEAQQIGFLDLIRKPESERTMHDLFEAGVVTRDDVDHPRLDYIKSDEFLREWLRTGYVHNEQIQNWYPINLTYADFRGALSGGPSPDDPFNVEGVSFENCDMRYASLDEIRFFNCNLRNADLQGATMYGGHVEDCNGQQDNDVLVANQLRDRGLIGLS